MSMSPPPPPMPGQDYAPPPQKKTNVFLWVLVGGAVLCICGGIPITLAILFPVFQQARLAATRTVCLKNMQAMAVGMTMYSADNNEALPLKSNWMDQLEKYHIRERQLHCPVLGRSGGHGYAMAADLASKHVYDLKDPETTVLIFETSNPDRNASGIYGNEAGPKRHIGKDVVGYVSGRAQVR